MIVMCIDCVCGIYHYYVVVVGDDDDDDFLLVFIFVF